MARFGSLGTQYFDSSGDPLVDGRIYFFDSGTTNPKVTYSDVANSIPNAHPVVLDADGRQPDIFFNGTAKAILTNSLGTQIDSADPVGETSTNFGSAWLAGRVYNGNEVVLASDGKFYKSVINANQGNDPTISPDEWVLLYSIQWAATETYAIGANVTDEDGLLYQSLVNDNTNNEPSSSPDEWTHVSGAWLPNFTYAIHQNAVGPDGVLYTSLVNDNIGNVPSSSPEEWVGTSAAAAASATAAYNAQLAAEAAETGAEAAETGAETAQGLAEIAQGAAEDAADQAEIFAAAAQAAAGLPSLTGNENAVLTVNGDATGVFWNGPKSVQSITSASTITPNADTMTQYNVTALAANATIAAPTGTPITGQGLIIRIKDNGTTRALTWNAIYRIIGNVLPTGTVPNATLYVGVKYNAQDVKWDVLAVAQEVI